MSLNKDVHINSLSDEQIKNKLKCSKNNRWRPNYHIYPPFGLLNDPNGLAYINEEYHLFFQWYPGGATHGLKHWYQLISSDLINYDIKNVAMSPTQIDKKGVFSGSHLQLENKNYMIYTSNGEDEIKQQQCIATYADNKISNRQLLIANKEYLPAKFRDPTAFNYQGKQYVIVGAKDKNDLAVLALYELENSQNVRFVVNLKLPITNMCTMIECPQILQIDGQYIIICSPQGLQKEGIKYQNTFNVVYALFDEICFKSGQLIGLSSFKELDYGCDFYAPQVFTADAQTLMYAWAGCGKSKYPESQYETMNVLTMPRKLSIDNQHLKQTVCTNYQKLIGASISVASKIFKPNSLSFKLTVNIENGDAIKIGSKSDYISISKEDNMLILDRSNCQHKIDSLHGDIRWCPMYTSKCELYIDNSIIEIFLNEGANTMTSRFFVSEQFDVNSTCEYEYAKIENINLNYTISDFK